MVTALSLMLLFVGGLGGYFLWAVAAIRSGADPLHVVVTLPLAYMAIFAAVTGLWFALAWFYRSKRPPEAQLGVRGTVHLFWREWTTLMGSGLRMGFGWWFMRDSDGGQSGM